MMITGQYHDIKYIKAIAIVKDFVTVIYYQVTYCTKSITNKYWMH